MKPQRKTMAGLTASAVFLGTLALPQTSPAGDRGWATAGKILTGLLVAEILSDGFTPALRCGTRQVRWTATSVYAAPGCSITYRHHWIPVVQTRRMHWGPERRPFGSRTRSCGPGHANSLHRWHTYSPKRRNSGPSRSIRRFTGSQRTAQRRVLGSSTPLRKRPFPSQTRGTVGSRTRAW